MNRQRCTRSRRRRYLEASWATRPTHPAAAQVSLGAARTDAVFQCVSALSICPNEPALLEPDSVSSSPARVPCQRKTAAGWRLLPQSSTAGEDTCHSESHPLDPLSAKIGVANVPAKRGSPLRGRRLAHRAGFGFGVDATGLRQPTVPGRRAAGARKLHCRG